MANVFNVAFYVTKKLGDITTMKLQKLVYYCQAWSLAWDGKPLFEEDFQAWANGPVCPQLFEHHKGKFLISSKDFNEFADSDFSDEEKETMDAVLNDLGDKSGQWLSDLTHSELPWQNARQGCKAGDRCENIIGKDDMQDYYGGLMS